MVDAVSSQGGYPNLNPQAGQSKPATAPAQGQPATNSNPTDTTTSVDSGALDGLVNGNLSNDQALAQSQAAGQQLANSGLSIANRSPQALANALPG